MLAHLLDRHLERVLRPGRPLPRWLRGLLDETFLWVAAGQLLLALGVRPGSVRRLSEVHDALEQARAALAAAGHPMPRLEGVRTYEDLRTLEERFDAFARGLEAIDPVELARIVPAPQAMGWATGAAGVLLDLALEVLDRLRARRIRTELVGLDHRALREGVLRLRRMLERSGLPEAAEQGYAAIGRRLEQIEADGALSLDDLALETPPVAPGLGEVGRLVDVVRSLPRPTLDQLIPLRLLTSRPVMITALTRVLEHLRAGWVPPAQRPAPATAAAPARQQVAAWDAERVRRRRVVDERDARVEVRRSHTVHAGLLWAAAAAVTAWMLWLVLGMFTPEWSAGLAHAAQLTPAALWLLPTGGICLVAALAVPAAEIIHHLDRAELGGLLPPGAARQRSRARRARGRAAAAVSRTGGALLLLPPVLAVVVGISRSFGGGLVPAGQLGWPFGLALLLPMAVVAAAHLAGSRRGGALEASRHPTPAPERPAAVDPPPTV